MIRQEIGTVSPMENSIEATAFDTSDTLKDRDTWGEMAAQCSARPHDCQRRRQPGILITTVTESS